MKKLIPTISILMMIFLSFSSCSKSADSGPQKYSFWQGAIVNKYYSLDICGDPTGERSGKPYMLLEYDPITNKPIKCEFGLSEADYKGLPRANPTMCIGSPPQPLLLASNFSYAERLELKGSVDLIANWYPVTILSDLSDGGFDFSVKVGKRTFHFEKTNAGMTGEIVDEGQKGWGDIVSDKNAFNMLYKFSSNTIGTK